MSHIAISFTVLGGAVALFAWNRLPVGIVAIASALALYLTGVLDLDQTLAGFADPTVIFVASLFVVSEGLQAGGVTTWAGQRLVTAVGDSKPRLLVFTMLLGAVLTAMISVVGAVTALLPVAVLAAVRLGQPASRLLIPLVYAAQAGSLLALTGTPVNVLVSEAAASAGARGFGFFTFALVGIPLLAGTVVITLTLGPRLLPDRTARVIPPDLSRHARTLIEEYLLEDGVFWLRVRPGSPYIGKPRAAVDLRDYPDLALVGVDTAHDGTRIEAGDTLMVRGRARAAGDLAARQRLAIRSETDTESIAGALFTREIGLAEVVIPPRSDLAGEVVSPGMTTSGGDLVVLAVRR
jgi:di/tricarboxylate transporter